MINEHFVKAYIEIGSKLGVNVTYLQEEHAEKYVSMVLKKHKPWRNSGHVQIATEKKDSIKFSADIFEFTYSEYLPKEPVCIFFDQSDKERNTVIKVEDGRKVGAMMKLYSLEYFLSNETADYLIAVNDYVVEYKGNNPEWFDGLEKSF